MTMVVMVFYMEIPFLLFTRLRNMTDTDLRKRWSLPIDKSFVNIAIVKEREQKDKEDRLRDASIEEQSRLGCLGQWEDIYRPKEEIPLEDIFKREGGKIPKRILILGRAGIGKSTLCQRIAYLWSAPDSKDQAGSNDIWMDRFDVVFWIPFREINTDKFPEEKGTDNGEYTFTDVIGRLCLDLSLTDLGRFSSQQLNTLYDNKKVLYLLDGYDEARQVPEGLRSVIEKLLNQKNAFTILTSRPYQLNMMGEVDKTLEVIGFKNEDILNYIRTPQVMRDDKQQETLLAFLESNHNVKGQCHIPILLDLLCNIWEERRGRLMFRGAISIVDLYYELVADLLERYRKKNSSDNTYKDEIGEKQKKVMGEIAFDAMCNGGNAIIENKLISNRVGEVEKNFCILYDIGILKPVGSFSGLKRKDACFLHLTFQEYFSADYVSKQSVEEIKNFVKENKYNPYYQEVLCFLAGILYASGEEEKIKAFFQSLQAPPRDIVGVYHIQILMRCLDACGKAELSDFSSLVLTVQKEVFSAFKYRENAYSCYLNTLVKTPFLSSMNEIQDPYLNIASSIEGRGSKHLWAISALARLGHSNDRTITMLINFLVSKGVKSSALPTVVADALVRLGHSDDRVIPAFVNFLNREELNQNNRVLAAKALVQLDFSSANVVTVLTDSLCNETRSLSVHTTRPIINILVRLSYSSRQAVITSLISVFNNAESGVAALSLAANALVQLKHFDKRIKRVLVDILNNKTASLYARSIAVSTVSKLAPENWDESVIMALICFLNDSAANENFFNDYCEVEDTLVKIGERGSRDVIVPLITFLNNKVADLDARTSVADILSKLGQRCSNSSVKKALISTITNKVTDLDARILAIDTLSKIEQGSSDNFVKMTLVNVLEDSKSSSFVCCSAANALIQLGHLDIRVEKKLIDVLNNKEEASDVRGLAASALGELGQGVVNESRTEALVYFLSDKSIDSYFRESAVEALGKLGDADKSVITALISFLDNEDNHALDFDARRIEWDIRSCAATALGKLGHSDGRVIPALVNFLQSSSMDALDQDIRARAADALGVLGSLDAHAIEALISIFGSTEGTYACRAVSKVLGRMDLAQRANIFERIPDIYFKKTINGTPISSLIVAYIQSIEYRESILKTICKKAYDEGILLLIGKNKVGYIENNCLLFNELSKHQIDVFQLEKNIRDHLEQLRLNAQ